MVELTEEELSEIIAQAATLGRISAQLDSIDASLDRWEKPIDRRLEKLDSPNAQ